MKEINNFEILESDNNEIEKKNDFEILEEKPLSINFRFDNFKFD